MAKKVAKQDGEIPVDESGKPNPNGHTVDHGMILVEKYAVGDRVTEERVTRLGQALVQAGWKIQHHDQGVLNDEAKTPARCLWMWKEPTAAEVPA